MAYIVGTVNSLQGLKAAIEEALSNEGWSTELEFLVKNGLYMKFTVVGDGLTPPSKLTALVGNSPTDTAPATPAVGPVRSYKDGAASPWSWPITYNMHILDNPLEVYVILRYGSFVQTLAFGQSPAEGNNGSGNWVHGFHMAPASRQIYPNDMALFPYGSVVVGNYSAGAIYTLTIPFFSSTVTYSSSMESGQPSLMHGAISSTGEIGWSDPRVAMTSYDNKGLSSALTLQPLLGLQPNTWNGEAVLLSCQIFQGRPERKISLIGELSHYRILRNDYLPDGSIITLGPDRWKIYPAYRRNTEKRDAGAFQDHSGTIAFAIRYDGP